MSANNFSTTTYGEPVLLAQFLPIPEGKAQYSISYIKQSQSIILEELSDRVTIGCVNYPSNSDIAMLEKLHRKTVTVVLVDRVEFFDYLSVKYALSISDLTVDTQQDNKNTLIDVLAQDAPVINLVNTIIMEAIQNLVTDIHIEYVRDSAVVRHRKDGVLVEVRSFDREYFKTIASRLKIMSHLDIMEQRHPQDGRLSVVIQKVAYDIRVSFLPAYYEESIVLRILQEQYTNTNLAQLGFSERNYKKIMKSLALQQGLILVSGPTGSGKTTTLHTILNSMNTGKEKIISIEEPIEYIVNGITQIQVNEKIGLTFDTLLRRVLRHDPDIIMVGEIRDASTASIVAQAALTGHLVFSTIHTSDTVSTILRLRDLGVDNFLIAAVLRGVISQRLVRKACPQCRGKILQTTCKICNNEGFDGRVLLEEYLPIEQELKYLLYNNATQEELRTYMKSKRIVTLLDNAKKKIKAGISTKEEIQKQVLLDE